MNELDIMEYLEDRKLKLIKAMEHANDLNLPRHVTSELTERLREISAIIDRIKTFSQDEMP